MYSVRSSWLRATLFVVDPVGAVGNNAAFRVSITVLRVRSTTETDIVIGIGYKKNFPLCGR